MVDLVDVMAELLDRYKALEIVQSYNKDSIFTKSNGKHRGNIATTLLYDGSDSESLYTDDDIENILTAVYEKTGLRLQASKGLFFWHFHVPKKNKL